MRNNKFRGVNTKGEFVYGSLVIAEHHLKYMPKQHTKTWIVTSAFGNGGWFNIRHREYVSPETVGQFTGLTDENGVDIYDGDIVQSYHFADSKGKRHFINHIVEWSDKFNGWFMRNEHGQTSEDGSIQLWVYAKSKKDSMEVIGNIHGVKHEK